MQVDEMEMNSRLLRCSYSLRTPLALPPNPAPRPSPELSHRNTATFHSYSVYSIIPPHHFPPWATITRTDEKAEWGEEQAPEPF